MAQIPEVAAGAPSNSAPELVTKVFGFFYSLRTIVARAPRSQQYRLTGFLAFSRYGAANQQRGGAIDREATGLQRGTRGDTTGNTKLQL
jgi:hypothetical protein